METVEEEPEEDDGSYYFNGEFVVFGKYEQEVARLQNEIDRIRAQAECKEESSAYTMRNIACNDSRKDYSAIIKVQGNKSPLPARLVVVE